MIQEITLVDATQEFLPDYLFIFLISVVNTHIYGVKNSGAGIGTDYMTGNPHMMSESRLYLSPYELLILISRFSMYRKYAYSRAVVFHTLHIGLRNTILCPYLVTCTILEPSVVPAKSLLPT